MGTNNLLLVENFDSYHYHLRLLGHILDSLVILIQYC